MAVSDLLWAHLLHLLAPICVRIIQLVCLLWILEHTSLSSESLYLFFREGAKAQVCNFSLVRRFRCLYLCAHWPPALAAHKEYAEGAGHRVWWICG